MIFSKNECVFIRHLSYLTLPIIFDAWWASMNVGPKPPIARNNSGHASSWWFYLECGIEETGSPGIICIVCYQVLCHPSEHGTSSMGKHLLTKALITMWNELTESEVYELISSKVDKTALAILKRQGSRRITIVSSQRKFLFHIPLNPYQSKWQPKHSKLAAKNFETSELHQAMWNRYLMLGFVFIHIAWNAISILEVKRSYRPLHSKIVLPLATTLSNICRRKYALTVDAIMKQLPSEKKVSLAFGRMEINKPTPHNVGHCLQYGSKLSITWSSTRFRQVWSADLFPIWKVIQDDTSSAILLGKR